MNTVTRFAPSPTGRLHLGHAYSAILAHRFARERHGTFLLRIEDIDPGRARAEHVDGIIEDLLWLGLEWDADMVYQSERLELYARGLERLKAMGVVYPCFCTRSAIAAEIRESAHAPHPGPGFGAGAPDAPVYPGICRRLGTKQRIARTASEPHAWRLDQAEAAAMTGALRWHDERAGDVEAEPGLFGDVVLARKDAPTSYHLAVTVDDAALGVTDIVRGVDLFAATHVHRTLQALLDLPTPRYHHHPLLLGPDGQRLAKRNGALALVQLRASGADPAALVEALSRGRLPAGYSLGSA